MQVFSNIINDSTSKWIKRCVIDMLLGLGLSKSSRTLCLNVAKLAIGELQEISVQTSANHNLDRSLDRNSLLSRYIYLDTTDYSPSVNLKGIQTDRVYALR